MTLVVAGFLLLFLPSAVAAPSLIARFTFITDPQSIASGAVSGELRIQAQDAGGNPVSAGKTLCLGVSSTSKTGEFSSNADNWNPINILTINSNWTARAFYYKDTGAGNYRIDADIALKPDGTTCAAWQVADWNVQWSARQNITIGSGGASSAVSPVTSASPAATSTSGGTSAYRAPVVPLPPAPTIQAFAGEDRIVLAGVEEDFVGEAIGLIREPIVGARFWWNFGDGETAEGKSVGHSYRAPGIYTVALAVSSGEYAASDYVVVRVIPNKITIAEVTAGEGGSVRIANPSGAGADIGGWIVEDDGGRRFFLPVHTIVGVGSEAAFANRVTGLMPDRKVILRYPGGSAAAEWNAGMGRGTAEKIGAGSSRDASSSPSHPLAIGVLASSAARDAHASSAKRESPAKASLVASALSAPPHGEAPSDTISRNTVYFPGIFFGAAFTLSAFAAAGFFFMRRIF